MSGSLAGASALIVGGASGMGAASARHFARELGAKVTIADIDAERGSDLAAELDGSFVACDVRDEDQVRAAATARRPLRRAVGPTPSPSSSTSSTST